MSKKRIGASPHAPDKHSLFQSHLPAMCLTRTVGEWVAIRQSILSCLKVMSPFQRQLIQEEEIHCWFSNITEPHPWLCPVIVLPPASSPPPYLMVQNHQPQKERVLRGGSHLELCSLTEQVLQV